MKSHRYEPAYFLPAHVLPGGFDYPDSYKRFVEMKTPNVGAINEDWLVLDKDGIEWFVTFAKEVAPDLQLVPFMRRNGEDGVACFNASAQSTLDLVYFFNYSENIGYGGGTLTFDDWLRTIPPREDDDDE